MAEQSSVPTLRFAGFTDAWEQRKLGEISRSFEYGLNAAATTYDGGNRYVRITDIDDETRLFSTADLTSPDIDLNLAENYRLQEGDIVFARTGASVGKTYIYKPSDGIMYYAGFLIRARIQPEYNADFVFQNTLTEQYRKFVAITSQRSGQPGINAQEYSTFEFSVPSYAEQQQIGAFFRYLDHLITLHQRKYSQLCNVKKAMLEKMFPKDGASVPEIRFAGFTDDWEQHKLGEFVRITSGEAPSKFTAGSELYVKVDDLNLSPKYVVNTKNKVARNKNIVKAESGSVVFPKRGAAILTNKVRILGVDSYMDTNMMALTADGLDSEFFYNIISKESLYRIADTSTIPQINNKHIEPYEVLVPSSEEQKLIGDFFRYLDHLITLHQQELERFQNIKKACLEKMFV